MICHWLSLLLGLRLQRLKRAKSTGKAKKADYIKVALLTLRGENSCDRRETNNENKQAGYIYVVKYSCMGSMEQPTIPVIILSHEVNQIDRGAIRTFHQHRLAHITDSQKFSRVLDPPTHLKFS